MEISRLKGGNTGQTGDDFKEIKLMKTKIKIFFPEMYYDLGLSQLMDLLSPYYFCSTAHSRLEDNLTELFIR